MVTSYEKTLRYEKLVRRPGAARLTSVAGVTAEADKVPAPLPGSPLALSEAR